LITSHPGPVIRIGVNELHTNNPEYFQQITKTGSKFIKESQFYRGISFPSASIGLVDPGKHRVRRQVLSPAFSPNRVQELSPRILEKVKQLCERFEQLAKSSSPVNINASFKAFTLDIISEIVFGEEFGVIDSPGFHHPHVDTLHAAIKQGWVSRSFPIFSQISLSLPERISTLLFPIPIEEFRRVRLIPSSISRISSFHKIPPCTRH